VLLPSTDHDRSVLFFLSAALIFRFLSLQAERAYAARLRELLPRRFLTPSLADVIREFPERLPAFRERALPLQARALGFNTLACGIFLIGLWIFPPDFLTGFDLGLLRFVGLAVVLAAFAFDVAAFSRLTRLSRTPQTLGEFADLEP
jgi:hypothetical protein